MLGIEKASLTPPTCRTLPVTEADLRREREREGGRGGERER